MGTNWAMFQRQVRGRETVAVWSRMVALNGSVDSSGVKKQAKPLLSENSHGDGDAEQSKVTIKGEPIIITIKNRVTGEVIQTINMEFPPRWHPLPG